MDTIPSSPSRPQRRSRADRAQRLHSFSRSWRRHLPTAALLTGLMSGLLPSAHAQATNTWDGTTGDWNTAASWSTGFVPNGVSNAGTFYAVVNPAGGSDNLTHSSSTGTGGVDFIFSFLNGGLFNLTGGVLAGSQANAASTFINNGTVNINGGTLRNFTISGTPLVFANNSGNMLDSDVFQNNINLAGGIARILNSLTIQSGSSANISAGGFLTAANSATLTGTVAFTDGNGNNVLGTENSSTLTLASGSLVHGISGQIGVAEFTAGAGVIVNHGTISSDGGGTIVLNPGGGTTSDGTLQAKNASTLRLDTALNATGGTLNVQDTSAINDNGTSVTGGTVTGNGRMTFANSAGDFLTGVTFSGATLDLTNGGIARFNGGLTLTGGSVANIAAAAYLSSTATGTLSGTVAFTDGNGNNSLSVENGSTLTLASGSLVHGIAGQVGVAQIVGGAGVVVNHGTISSDGGGLIVLNPGGGTTNDGGLLQAKQSGTTGSTLRLDSAVTNINGGSLNIADAASVIADNGTSVTGGTVTGSGRMTFTGSGSNFLTGLTFNGATLDLTNGGVARIVNSLTLTGGSVANVAADAYLAINNSATLSGTVAFTDSNGNNSLSVENGSTLTLASGSLVHGIAGQVGLARLVGGNGVVINHGTISSDGGGLIVLNPAGGTTSDGTLQAKNGSTLRLDTALNSTGGTLNVQDTSAINDNGTTITGGTVTGSGRMTFTGSGSNFLTGVTFSGATLDLTNGGAARLQNTLTLTGGSVANISAGAYLTAATNTTLTGTVAFTDGNGNNSLATENGDTLTLASGSLAHGITGQVGVARIVGGNGVVVNNGTIKSDGGGTITINPVTLTNGATGTIQAAGGNVTVAPVLNNTGSVLVSPGNTITASSGETQTGGVTQIDGTFTGPVALSGGTLKGVGTLTGNVTQTAGTVAPGDSPGTLSVTGTFDGSGGGVLSIEYTASQTAATAHDLLAVSGAVTLGGQRLDVSFVGPPNPNGTYLATTGEPGTTFDFLSFGTLTNGGLGGLFTNEFTQGGNFFVNGIASNNVGSSPAVYQLTQNGNALHLTLTTAATPEPSQWAAFGLGVLGLAGLGLRARRKASHSA